MVVVFAPRRDRPTRVVHVEKPALVEALVSKAPIEALDEGVLGRLARGDEVKTLAPARRCLTWKLR